MKIHEQSTAAGGEGFWWYFRGAAFDNIQLSVETHLGEKQQCAETPVVIAPLMPVCMCVYVSVCVCLHSKASF